MSDARLVGRQDLVVQLDNSTFYLHTADLDTTQVVEVAQRAAASAGVAQSNGLLVLESPEQYNFDMGLTIEIWDEQPTDDLRAWSDAFEAHLDVGTGGLTYESPTLDRVPIDVPPGSYHALITGRGYNDGEDPTAPGGSWRIRLWPSPGPDRPARIRGWASPQIRHPAHQFATAGTAAVRRIHSYLDDARHLSGERGTATAQRRMPGTRRRLFDFFEDPSDWLTQHGDGGSVHGRGYILYCDHDYADDRSGEANLIVPSDGIVDYGIVETKPPEYTVATWTWIRLPAGRTGSRRQDARRGTVLIPAQPQMTVRFDLTNAGRDDGTPTTLVRVTHDHVPVEWVDDLTAYWHWTLERGDYDLDLSDARRRGYSH